MDVDDTRLGSALEALGGGGSVVLGQCFSGMCSDSTMAPKRKGGCDQWCWEGSPFPSCKRALGLRKDAPLFSMVLSCCLVRELALK